MIRYLDLNLKTWLALWILAFPFGFNLNAQVTIGLGETPERAALLQLKDKTSAPDAKDATATSGGLLLPRVELKGLREFTLIAKATEAQKKDHTGLLVYNQKVDAELQLYKGVYQWNGEKWKMLQKTTKTEGLSVKKVIYQAKSPDEKQVLSLGIFEFRMARPTANRRCSQFRLAPGLKKRTVHVLINWDQDPDIEAESQGWESKNNPYFYFGVKTSYNQADDWTEILSWEKNAEKHEIWLSDLDNDNIYHVRFLSFGGDEGYTDKIYSIIAQKY
ncbi:MAG: hypothetical protein LBQ65_04380 [Tannerellaceae bacterium]|jgi:hypothetical protein|nr:hypothetical protein [Tannerellaceae bacterium]